MSVDAALPAEAGAGHVLTVAPRGQRLHGGDQGFGCM